MGLLDSWKKAQERVEQRPVKKDLQRQLHQRADQMVTSQAESRDKPLPPPPGGDKPLPPPPLKKADPMSTATEIVRSFQRTQERREALSSKINESQAFLNAHERLDYVCSKIYEPVYQYYRYEARLAFPKNVQMKDLPNMYQDICKLRERVKGLNGDEKFPEEAKQDLKEFAKQEKEKLQNAKNKIDALDREKMLGSDSKASQGDMDRLFEDIDGKLIKLFERLPALMDNNNSTLKKLEDNLNALLERIDNVMREQFKEIGFDLYEIKEKVNNIAQVEIFIKNKHNSILTSIEDMIRKHEEGWNKDSLAILSPQEIQVCQEQLSRSLDSWNKAMQPLTEIKSEFTELGSTLITFAEEDIPQSVNDLRGEIQANLTKLKSSFDELVKRHQNCRDQLNIILNKYDNGNKAELLKQIDQIYSENPNNKVEKIEEALKKRYPEATEEFASTVKNLAKIRSLLMDRKYSNQVFKKIQDEMRELDETGERKLPFYDMLQKYEVARGFEKQVLKVKGFLLARKFLIELLSKKRHMVDLGVEEEHGDSIHRVQWLPVYAAFEENEKKIDIEPVEIYKNMGNKAFVNKKEINIRDDIILTVWDDTFDALRPAADSLVGISSEFPSMRRYHIRGYCDPFYTTENFFKDSFPPGPLKAAIQFQYLQRTHFGGESLLGEEECKESIKDKILEIESRRTRDKQRIQEQIEDWSFAERHSDDNSRDKKIDEKIDLVKQELKDMTLPQLEKRYGALGQAVPTKFDPVGNYQEMRDRILKENGLDTTIGLLWKPGGKISVTDK